MSLKDKRNSTTSPFSFLIGTIFRRHQNGFPADIGKGITLRSPDTLKTVLTPKRRDWKVSAWSHGYSPHHFSYRSTLLPGTPAGPPALCPPAGLHSRWFRFHGGSRRYTFSASPHSEQSRSAHKTHRSSTRWGGRNVPEHYPGGSYCLWGKWKKKVGGEATVWPGEMMEQQEIVCGFQCSSECNVQTRRPRSLVDSSLSVPLQIWLICWGTKTENNLCFFYSLSETFYLPSAQSPEIV